MINKISFNNRPHPLQFATNSRPHSLKPEKRNLRFCDEQSSPRSREKAATCPAVIFRNGCFQTAEQHVSFLEIAENLPRIKTGELVLVMGDRSDTDDHGANLALSFISHLLSEGNGNIIHFENFDARGDRRQEIFRTTRELSGGEKRFKILDISSPDSIEQFKSMLGQISKKDGQIDRVYFIFGDSPRNMSGGQAETIKIVKEFVKRGSPQGRVNWSIVIVDHHGCPKDSKTEPIREIMGTPYSEALIVDDPEAPSTTWILSQLIRHLPEYVQSHPDMRLISGLLTEGFLTDIAGYKLPATSEDISNSLMFQKICIALGAAFSHGNPLEILFEGIPNSIKQRHNFENQAQLDWLMNELSNPAFNVHGIPLPYRLRQLLKPSWGELLQKVGTVGSQPLNEKQREAIAKYLLDAKSLVTYALDLPRLMDISNFLRKNSLDGIDFPLSPDPRQCADLINGTYDRLSGLVRENATQQDITRFNGASNLSRDLMVIGHPGKTFLQELMRSVHRTEIARSVTTKGILRSMVAKEKVPIFALLLPKGRKEASSFRVTHPFEEGMSRPLIDEFLSAVGIHPERVPNPFIPTWPEQHPSGVSVWQCGGTLPEHPIIPSSPA